MRARALSDVGLKRSNNQDSYFYDVNRGLYVIADGMGGYAGGEIASAIVVDVLRKGYTGLHGGNYKDVLDVLLQKANHAVYIKAEKQKELQGMGTTAIVLVTEGNAFYLAHVGDSRAYLIRKDSIQRLSEDHNVSGELMKEGHLTEKEAMRHPGKNMLTRVLGRHPELTADFCEGTLEPDDYILLCSDGLTGLVESEEIAAIVRGGDDLAAALRAMVDLALERGGDDNITAILMKNCEY